MHFSVEMLNRQKSKKIFYTFKTKKKKKNFIWADIIDMDFQDFKNKLLLNTNLRW